MFKLYTRFLVPNSSSSRHNGFKRDAVLRVVELYKTRGKTLFISKIRISVLSLENTTVIAVYLEIKLTNFHYIHVTI